MSRGNNCGQQCQRVLRSRVDESLVSTEDRFVSPLLITIGHFTGERYRVAPVPGAVKLSLAQLCMKRRQITVGARPSVSPAAVSRGEARRPCTGPAPALPAPGGGTALSAPPEGCGQPKASPGQEAGRAFAGTEGSSRGRPAPTLPGQPRGEDPRQAAQCPSAPAALQTNSVGNRSACRPLC